MLRVRIVGSPLATTGTPGVPPIVKPIPYLNLYQQTDLTVGVAAVSLGTITQLRNNKLWLRNLSTSGQRILIGDQAVAFGAPNIGKLLYPGEELIVDPYDPNSGSDPGIISSAVADAANATLGRWYLSTYK